MVVQQVRTEQKLTYAQAVKVVDIEKKEREIIKPVNKEGEGISTEKLVLFISYVTNCAEQVSSKRDKVKMIMKAAGLFLNVKERKGMGWLSAV